MPRLPRNPGAGKAPYNGPARAPQDDRSGPGYGGPSRGASSAPASIQTAPTFDGSPVVKSSWRLRKDALGEKAMSVWEGVLDNPGETTTNRIVAAEKIMDRVDGKPKQTQEHTGDMAFTIVTGVPRAAD